MSSRDTLSNPLTFGRFKNWVLRHTQPGTSRQDIDYWLEDYRKQNPDFTIGDAISDIQAPRSPPATDLNSVIDWISVQIEEGMKKELERSAQAIREALETGKIRPAEIGLYRKEEVTISVPKLWQERLRQIEAKLEELTKKPTPPSPPPSPEVRPPTEESRYRPVFPQEFAELLFELFKNKIEGRFKRELTAPEINEFEKLLMLMEKQKPPLSQSQARKQVETLAQSLIGRGTGGRIIIQRQQQRIDELVEKSFTEGLTEEEEEELAQLRTAERMLPEEEIIYQPPTIVIWADSGPMPVKYPYELMRTWSDENARENVARFTEQGFKVRVESA